MASELDTVHHNNQQIHRYTSVHFSSKYIKGITHTDILNKLEKYINREKVKAIQLTERECVVTVDDQASKILLLIKGIELKNYHYKFVDVEKEVTRVTIKDAPVELGDLAVCTFMRQYGASNCCHLKISDSRIHNASVSGSTAEDIDKLLVTLDKSVDKKYVSKVIFGLGTNDVTKNNTDKEIICINMTNALNKVKAEFPNADISIFSILPRKGKGPNFTKCNLTSHSVNMYMEKVCSKDQRLSFIDLWDDFCQPGMGVNPVKTLFDKNDPSGVHVNPEGSKQLVSHIKNFMSIDRLGEYETPSGKKRTRSSASTPGSAEKQLPKIQNSSLEETVTK
ncbi:unnamed protein product [Mytilus coruscus]|uniref:SGNH hydrolase-type esterase domain-containing protein n=1 Tax=Mytilus coruscus TaxID=42192 RepID=A0A6J8E6E0_MYTCO|nr:unnamed protein product [Mytilus coruscus]